MYAENNNGPHNVQASAQTDQRLCCSHMAERRFSHDMAHI